MEEGKGGVRYDNNNNTVLEEVEERKKRDIIFIYYKYLQVKRDRGSVGCC